MHYRYSVRTLQGATTGHRTILGALERVAQLRRAGQEPAIWDNGEGRELRDPAMPEALATEAGLAEPDRSIAVRILTDRDVVRPWRRLTVVLRPGDAEWLKRRAGELGCFGLGVGKDRQERPSISAMLKSIADGELTVQRVGNPEPAGRDVGH